MLTHGRSIMQIHACVLDVLVTEPTPDPNPGSTHLIVPFAQVLSPFGREIWQGWTATELPHLRLLLGHLEPSASDLADEMSWTPPHERVLAQAHGWPQEDGVFPWAAYQVAINAWADPTQPWARITPAHWHLGSEHIRMAPVHSLGLDNVASQAFLEAVRELFESEGFELCYADPLSWLVSHPSLQGLPSASLDRVAGRSVSPWMSQDSRSRLLRRLQNEVQMLLHQHPLNEAREAQGLLPINSFWWSACGALKDLAPVPQPAVQVIEGLRGPALEEDAQAWRAAWKMLDAKQLAAFWARHLQGEHLKLTLCGERGARTWQRAGASSHSWTRHIVRWWRGSDPWAALEGL